MAFTLVPLNVSRITNWSNFEFVSYSVTLLLHLLNLKFQQTNTEKQRWHFLSQAVEITGLHVVQHFVSIEDWLSSNKYYMAMYVYKNFE
jgi:hypothetical protein